MLLDKKDVADRVKRLIELERIRQDAKWGEQNHDASTWLMVLTEELGEVAKAHLEMNRIEYVTELTQCAAVLIAWLECEIRGGGR